MKISYKEIERRRKTIEWFDNVKMAKLLENSYKGTWRNDSIANLIEKMLGEIEELKEALENGSHNEIIRECADISNYAMFIADTFNN